MKLHVARCLYLTGGECNCVGRPFFVGHFCPVCRNTTRASMPCKLLCAAGHQPVEMEQIWADARERNLIR